MRHLEIYVFACGHGDTLLIRLPDKRGVLVDCFLPKAGGVRERFFDFLKDKEIEHLAAVFQTHPDYDHFHGMREVLAHFIETKGTKVGLYADSGLNAQEINALLGIGRSEYSKLIESLREWDEKGMIDWRELDAERPPIIPKGYRDRIHFVPVAPDPKLKRQLTEHDIVKMGRNPDAELEANELSLVLTLMVTDQKTQFNALLSADAGSESIRRAMQIWQSYATERKVAPCFHVIKVSHHGSIHNHCDELCKHGPHPKEGPKTAAISAGQRAALPDQQVIYEYLQAGWTVVTTTIRTPAKKSRAAQLHFKGPTTVAYEEHTLEFLWEDDGQFKFLPNESLVKAEHLGAYGTAKI